LHLAWADDLGWEMCNGIVPSANPLMKICAKILITSLLCWFWGCMLPAQNALLRFDPKWAKEHHVDFNKTKLLVAQPSPKQSMQMPVPQAWCYSDLAFFCKIEVKMEKAIRFPVKFRLGDVGYVDRLEGKRATY
jgi:hypothetical protein